VFNNNDKRPRFLQPFATAAKCVLMCKYASLCEKYIYLYSKSFGARDVKNKRVDSAGARWALLLLLLTWGIFPPLFALLRL